MLQLHYIMIMLCEVNSYCYVAHSLLIVKHPREAALDAQCCASIAHLGRQKAQALTTGFGSFSIAEFVEKLV